MLQTVTASDSKMAYQNLDWIERHLEKGGQNCVTYQIARLAPTLRARMTGNINENRKKDNQRNLESVLSLLLIPTPTKSCWKDSPGMNLERGNRTRLDTTGRRIGAVTGLKLRSEFTEWMMGFPLNWTRMEGHSRRDRIEGIGNAVVPQVAEVLFRAIVEADQKE